MSTFHSSSGELPTDIVKHPLIRADLIQQFGEQHMVKLQGCLWQFIEKYIGRRNVCYLGMFQ